MQIIWILHAWTSLPKFATQCSPMKEQNVVGVFTASIKSCELQNSASRSIREISIHAAACRQDTCRWNHWPMQWANTKYWVNVHNRWTIYTVQETRNEMGYLPNPTVVIAMYTMITEGNPNLQINIYHLVKGIQWEKLSALHCPFNYRAYHHNYADNQSSSCRDYYNSINAVGSRIRRVCLPFVADWMATAVE